MQEEEKKGGMKKWVLISGLLVLILVIALFLILFFAKDSPIAISIGKVLPFGTLVEDVPKVGTGDIGGIDPGKNTTGNTQVGESEPLFRQISNRQVAGATTIVRDEIIFVRYALRENGNIFELNTETGATSQLTNTTIPQVQEAFFGDNGNAVVLRYIKQDRYSGQDTIKTYVGTITPVDASTGSPGEIRGEYLPVNINMVSISPDGSTLFYLIPDNEGTTGFIKKLNTAFPPKEVLRSSFAEWLPQLFDNGTVMLSTKPSANIAGFSYLYNPEDKSMTRLVREKKGLTALGTQSKDIVLFGENIAGNATLGFYSKKGFVFDEGNIVHEISIPITGIPEKCVWGQKVGQLYCASFSLDQRGAIPDDWYQGTLSFSDTFWMVYPQTQEIKMLADPKKEIKTTFDVLNPFVDANESYFFFTDKNTGFLWSMRIERPADTTELPLDLPPPPPEEAGDAAGSR